METHSSAVSEVPLASPASSGELVPVLQRVIDGLRELAGWIAGDILGIEPLASTSKTGDVPSDSAE